MTTNELREAAQAALDHLMSDMPETAEVLLRAALTATTNEAPSQAEPNSLLEWACWRWREEVQDRPLVNVHRRTLDDTWRQVIRHAGGDPDALVGPSHDALVAALAASAPSQAEPTKTWAGLVVQQPDGTYTRKTKAQMQDDDLVIVDPTPEMIALADAKVAADIASIHYSVAPAGTFDSNRAVVPLNKVERLIGRLTNQHAAPSQAEPATVPREKYEALLTQEHALSDSYVRLRRILGAMNPPSLTDPQALFSYVETVARKVVGGAPSQAGSCQASEPVSSRDAAEALLAAGHEFWLSVGRENYKAQGAVQWLTASDGALVLFTRGEYKQTLLNNIATLPGAAVVNWEQPGDEDEDERGLIACSKDAPPAGRTLTDDAETFKAAMKSLHHADYPGGNLWEITTVREKSLMLKAWRAASSTTAGERE